MATGQDPGSLGVYGSRNRPDRSYRPGVSAPARPADAPAIWDLIAGDGGRAIVLGMPQETSPHVLPRLPEIEAIVATYPTNAQRQQQFQVVRRLMEHHGWDYLQFVAIGPHGDDGQSLDNEIGGLLERVDDNTLVLIASVPGTHQHVGSSISTSGSRRKGYSCTRPLPRRPCPSPSAPTDWEKTRAWSEGGPCGQVFLNVRGREPQGVIDPTDARRFREDLKARLEAATSAEGKPLGLQVFRPEEIYRDVQNVAPDLIFQFGASRGAFVLAGGSVPAIGPVEGVHLLDLAPTLLELSGREVPATMQGRSLASTGLDASGMFRPPRISTMRNSSRCGSAAWDISENHGPVVARPRSHCHNIPILVSIFTSTLLQPVHSTGGARPP